MLGLRWRQWGGLGFAAAALLVVALLFGGASRSHALRLALVELAALPALVVAIRAILNGRADTQPSRLSVLLLVGALAVPLIQLVPLPPAIWTGLAGRDKLVLALEVAGLSQPWLPLTLVPDKTWTSFLALLPPVAMFLMVMSLRPEGRSMIVKVLVGLTMLSVALGALQFASGTDRFHPWATTDAGSVTGFFANRNHLATLCLVSLPFAVVLGAGAIRRHRGEEQVYIWLTAVYVAVIAIALAVIRSRAGVVLFPLVAVASLGAAWIAAGRGQPKALLIPVAAGAALAIAAVAAFALAPLLDRFDPNAAPEGRFENWPLVVQAAEAHLPLGSGVGSFDPVYRSIEPLAKLDPTFFNQAHNDYLEIWLETGWLGAGLVIAFMVWFVRRLWQAWSSPASSARDLQRAATVATGAVLLHSAADYPVRTATIATVLALCCGLVELAGHASTERTRRSSSRHR